MLALTNFLFSYYFRSSSCNYRYCSSSCDLAFTNIVAMSVICNLVLTDSVAIAVPIALAVT